MSTAVVDTPLTSGPLERWALRLSRVGLLVIVAVTFVTSFDAVSAVAVARGAVSPHLAWAIPLAIDGLIVVGSAVAWVESLRGGRWHAFPVVLVAVAGGLSVAANVAHAPGTDPLARALAAVPPVALLAAVELGAWQIRRQVHREETPVAPVASVADADASATTLALAEAIRAELAAGTSLEGISKQAIADAVGVHRATAYRKWDDAVTVAANGHGQ